jgi:hypothetical protein
MGTLTTRYAAGILLAWRGNDRELLRASLAGAAALEPAGDSDERERGELLSGVAAEMQDMIASGTTEGSAVCLSLLRHLMGRGRGDQQVADAALQGFHFRA